MYTASDHVEATLLAAIADDASCDVYADWLEERGDMDRAELVRLQRALRRDPRNRWLHDRIAILSRNVDPAWRDRVMQRPHAVDVEVETPPLPPPRPATVQLASPPQPLRRETRAVVPGVVWMTSTMPAWIRIPSRFAAGALAISFVLYWLL